MNIDQRKEVLLRNIAEVVKDEEINTILQKDHPSAYIGYTPTGTMHIGHFTTLRKIKDFVDAGLHFNVLIADVHAELDIEKSPLELVKARTKYYEEATKAMLRVVGVREEDVTFVRGSDFQFERTYQKNVMRLMENTTVNRAQRAVNEVVRHNDSMKASGLLYCIMQVQDAVALDVDICYAGMDQRRIYMLGRESLPKIGIEGHMTCAFAPLLTGLSGGKMSASDASSKIGIHDDKAAVKEKMNSAYCPAGEAKENGVLEYIKYLILPVLQTKGEAFTITRPEKYGGDLSFDAYDELESVFVAGDLHPADLKKAAGTHLNNILEPIRETFAEKQDLLSQAYPDEF